MLVTKSVLAAFFTCCWIATSVLSLPEPTVTVPYDASKDALGIPNVAFEAPSKYLDKDDKDDFGPLDEPKPILGFEASDEGLETTNVTNDPLKNEEYESPTHGMGNFDSATQAYDTPTPDIDGSLQPTKSPKSLQYSIAYVSGSAGKREYFPLRFQDIDASGYTHLIYSFASIDEKNQLVISDNDESTYLRELIAFVKASNPSIKVLIAVGGANAKNGIEERFTDQYNSTDVCPSTRLRLLAKTLCSDIIQIFHKDAAKPQSARMINNADGRSTFIQSALSLIKEFGADGLDLDWEYLSELNTDGKVEDSDNFVALVKELRAAFPPEYWISAAIPDGLSTYFAAVKVAEIVEHLNFITSMTFDLHGFWEYTTDKDASGGKLAAHTDIRDVKAGIDVTVAEGVPLEKLMLGLAFYGQSYKQSEPYEHEIGSLYIDPKKAMPDVGKSTGHRGVLGFNEINDVIVNNQTSVRFNKFDELTNTNILAFGTDQWVSYDNGVTMKERLTYAYNYGLGGTTVRYLDLDDKEHQLSKAIKDTREDLMTSVGDYVDVI